MKRTIYSLLGSGELTEFALLRDNVTEMEIELAQRLQIAMAMLEEVNGADSRRESEGRRQKAAN
jgi:hypothetical protein